MRGMTLVELLVGMVLGLVAAAAMTALLRVGVARRRARRGRRGDGDRDRRRRRPARPRRPHRRLRSRPAPASPPSPSPRADRLELQADLDGNGAIDASSEERIGYRVAPCEPEPATRSSARSRCRSSPTSPPTVSRLVVLRRRGRSARPDRRRAPATRPASSRSTSRATPRGRTASVHVHGGARLVNR